MAAPDLTGRTISSTYKDLLQVSNSNAGVDATSRSVQDGEGTVSALELSTGGVKSTGTLESTGDTTVGGNLVMGSTTITATGAELNYSDGVTSNIQTQLDGKAASSHTHTLSDVTDSGTAAALDVPSSGDAASGEVVKGDDSRLTEVTLTGTPDYITISGQEITRNEIDLAADVTGSLPDGNIASAATWNALTTNATHTGEVTGSGALTVADDVIDEANLKVDNAPTDDYVLTAKSSAAGGLTWASAGSGSGDMTGVDITAGDGLDISQSNTTSGDYTATISADLKTNGGIVVESGELAVDLGTGSTQVAAGDHNHDSDYAATSHSHSNFTGDSGSGGSAGMVPAPAAGDAAADKYLDADGTWSSPPASNITTQPLFEHSNTISADYTIGTGNNAVSAGDPTIGSGYTVTVPSGSSWVVV